MRYRKNYINDLIFQIIIYICINGFPNRSTNCTVVSSRPTEDIRDLKQFFLQTIIFTIKIFTLKCKSLI